MKTFQTGKTIRLHNIEDSYWDLNVGDIFYNFVKDIATPKYEVLDKKYIFRSVDPDDIDENGNMYTYNPVEVSKDDFKDTGLFLAVTSDDGGEAIIVLTIKNIETGEIFEDISEEHNGGDYNSEFIEWSSKDENDAFELADWYFKTKY